mmetsp:Transcript_45204/g.133842  ORF Transcript_45204/g.133842 Transcript_45204/m.133842 type:complete len:201 (+) Transcript_45204:74-676(+)
MPGREGHVASIENLSPSAGGWASVPGREGHEGAAEAPLPGISANPDDSVGGAAPVPPGSDHVHGGRRGPLSAMESGGDGLVSSSSPTAGALPGAPPSPSFGGTAPSSRDGRVSPSSPPTEALPEAPLSSSIGSTAPGGMDGRVAPGGMDGRVSSKVPRRMLWSRSLSGSATRQPIVSFQDPRKGSTLAAGSGVAAKRPDA